MMFCSDCPTVAILCTKIHEIDGDKISFMANGAYHEVPLIRVKDIDDEHGLIVLDRMTATIEGLVDE